MRIALVFLVLMVACSAQNTARPPEELTGYVWLNRMPKNDTDLIDGMFVVQRKAQGAFFRSSRYRHLAEAFVAMRDGERLRLQFPQTGKQAQLTFKIERCDAPDHFEDVCLVLSKNPWDGPTRYFGVKIEEARKQPALASVLAGVEP